MPETVQRGLMEFEAIGTHWRIDTPDPIPFGTETRITASIADFDRVWSRFRPDSLVSLLAREGGSVPVGPDGSAMLAELTRLFDLTDGAVNPLVGQALEHLGYDASYRLVPLPGEPAPVPVWDGVFSAPTAKLTISAPAVLDVGAVGKGRLVDIVSEILGHAGIERATVDAGGDLRHYGEPLRIALEHPYDASRAVGVVTIADGAIAASATNRRTWADGLHHMLDARTAAPVRSIVATWATATTAMAADAAASAAFFVEPDRVLAAMEDVTSVVRMPLTGPLESAGFLGRDGVNGELFG